MPARQGAAVSTRHVRSVVSVIPAIERIAALIRSPMKTLLWLLSILCTAGVAAAGPFDSPAATPLHGSFLVSVDDHATIFVNGVNVHHANIGTSRSRELDLKVGDQIVVQLVNDVGPKHFIMVFQTTDQQRICSFKASDYRIITELDVKSFSPGQFETWTKHAKEFKGHKGLEKQVKNYSQYVWGDIDRCALACTITPGMITVTPK